MAKLSDPKPDDDSFLGGGPKFNQAGNNAPMPGERVSEAQAPPPFGGPRVWIGTIAVIVLLVLLYILYLGGIGGVRSTFSPRGSTINDRAPSANPDSP